MGKAMAYRNLVYKRAAHKREKGMLAMVMVTVEDLLSSHNDDM